MPRKTKKEEIEKLKADVEFYKGLMDEVLKRNSQLAESRDERFSISPHRFQLEDKLAFFEQLYKLETNLYDSLKLQMHRRVHDLVEKQLHSVSDPDEINLFLGYTERHLKDQVLELTAKVENRDETIEILMSQIEDYRSENAVLKRELEYHQADQPSEYRECIEKLKSSGAALRERHEELLASYNALLALFSDDQLKGFPEKHINTIKDKVNKIIQKSSILGSSEYKEKEMEYFGQEEKMKLVAEIKHLEHELSKLSNSLPAKSGRPPSISSKDIEKMQELREQKYSYRKIADTMGCSVGTVFRLISK